MFRDATPIFEFKGPWGVPVQIGGSIVLLLLLVLNFGGPTWTMSYQLTFAAILIGSILLHELGHAWGCLIQGVPVRRIMLYGGGGLCERSRSATRHEQELIVAMGPIVNLVLWALAGLLSNLVSDPQIHWVLITIAWVNGFLALFNLIPVQPLDGGKLFELLLCRVLPTRLATQVAGFVGLAISIAWIPLMICVFLTSGLIFFFLPAATQHWRMLRGQPT